MTEVFPKNTRKFRYLIFQFKGKETASLAELEFWGLENGQEVKLTGLKIGNPGDHGHSIDNVMDGNRLKYFKNEKSGQTYIGLDLGRGHEKCVTKIRFCPRNDTNNILPDNLYELFYWDNEWKSLGIKKGEDMKPLIYEKAPVGTLFWLQNRSEGQEERIFTYENGQQVWW
jgi:hypothetical protein